jgi:hypothetical protein
MWGAVYRAVNIVVLAKSRRLTVKCKRAQKMLADYVNEVLEAGDRHQLQQHVVECEICRRELDILKTVFRLIDDVEVEYPPASVWQNFLPDLHRRIENEAALLFKKQKRQRFYILPGWAATVAVVLILLTSLMLQDHAPIRATGVREAESIRFAENYPAAEDASEFALVAGAISRVLITEAEAEKLRELRSASQPETPMFPYYPHYDDSDALIDTRGEADTTQNNEDVIKYLEDEFAEFDENLMIESDDTEFGAI